MSYVCPVCRYEGLKVDPGVQDYSTCPCCFTEFGLDDSIVAFINNLEEQSEEVWIILRKKWYSGGMNWFSS